MFLIFRDNSGYILLTAWSSVRSSESWAVSSPFPKVRSSCALTAPAVIILSVNGYKRNKHRARKKKETNPRRFGFRGGGRRDKHTRVWNLGGAGGTNTIGFGLLGVQAGGTQEGLGVGGTDTRGFGFWGGRRPTDHRSVGALLCVLHAVLGISYLKKF